jgi:hypothetical protein
VQIELKALARTLKHLEGLEPNESNITHLNAIRGMALTCRIPLQEFLEKTEKFERRMGAFSMDRSAKAFGRKSQWAIFMSEEVAKLRTAVGAKVLSINLLLATHTSESISRIESQSRKSHAILLASILDLRNEAARGNTTLRTTETVVNSMANDQKRHHRDMKQAMDNATLGLGNVFDAVTATSTAVMSFRDLGTQLIQLIRGLPEQVRVTLEQVVRSNLEMYDMLRTMQTMFSQSPRYDPADTFRFEDVLGRSQQLPYQYFNRIEVFKAFLKTEFEGLPGQSQVLQTRYKIADLRSLETTISEQDWKSTVFPGANLVMFILVNIDEDTVPTLIDCPRPGCEGRGERQGGQKHFLTWYVPDRTFTIFH